MIFPFKITVYDYPKEIKIIDLFYTRGAICMNKCGICFWGIE